MRRATQRAITSGGGVNRTGSGLGVRLAPSSSSSSRLFESHCIGQPALVSRRSYGEVVEEPMWRKVDVKAKGKGMKTVIKADKHEITLDEPKSVGGTDAGPSPFHAVLGALAGCEQATVHYLIKNKACNLDIEKIYFEVEGHYDARGVMGIGNITPGFQKVKLIARVKTTASQAEIDELARKVQRHNPVASLFMSANVPLEMEWKKLEKEE